MSGNQVANDPFILKLDVSGFEVDSAAQILNCVNNNSNQDAVKTPSKSEYPLKVSKSSANSDAASNLNTISPRIDICESFHLLVKSFLMLDEIQDELRKSHPLVIALMLPRY